MQEKKVLIVDDEADFASRNYSTVKRKSLVDDDGNEHYKTFDKTELSANANLMFNDLESIINEEYGDSLSANEKRQVLFELIQNSFN